MRGYFLLELYILLFTIIIITTTVTKEIKSYLVLSYGGATGLLFNIKEINLTLFLNFRCFQSKNGQVAIYVEATESDTVHRRVADIEYDLQPLPRGGKVYDPAEGKHQMLILY